MGEGPLGWYNEATGKWDKAEPSGVAFTDTPYAGTSGHMGTDTSEGRARADDASGRTAARRQAMREALEDAGWMGMTWRELAVRYGWHHGEASGVLTRSHKAGLIVRLATVRNGCKVYVLPRAVDGRRTEPYEPRLTSKQLGERLAQAEALLVEARVRVKMNHGLCNDPTCRVTRLIDNINEFIGTEGSE